MVFGRIAHAVPDSRIDSMFARIVLLGGDVWWDPSPNDRAPQTLEQRKAEFEKYGTTLLAVPLDSGRN